MFEAAPRFASAAMRPVRIFSRRDRCLNAGFHRRTFHFTGSLPDSTATTPSAFSSPSATVRIPAASTATPTSRCLLPAPQGRCFPPGATQSAQTDTSAIADSDLHRLSRGRLHQRERLGADVVHDLPSQGIQIHLLAGCSGKIPFAAFFPLPLAFAMLSPKTNGALRSAPSENCFFLTF